MKFYVQVVYNIKNWKVSTKISAFKNNFKVLKLFLLQIYGMPFEISCQANWNAPKSLAAYTFKICNPFTP